MPRALQIMSQHAHGRQANEGVDEAALQLGGAVCEVEHERVDGLRLGQLHLLRRRRRVKRFLREPTGEKSVLHSTQTPRRQGWVQAPW